MRDLRAAAVLLPVPGLAGRSLVDVARAVGAQLLVLAGGGTASVLPGTTSQYVLRKAPCPVLVVPAGSGAAWSVLA